MNTEIKPGFEKEAQDKGEKSIASDISIGDVVVSKSGARRKVLEIKRGNDYVGDGAFVFERVGKPSELPRKEEMEFGHLDDVKEKIDYVVNPNQQKEADISIKLGNISKGDIFGKSLGSRRVVVEFSGNENSGSVVLEKVGNKDPQKKERIDIKTLSENLDKIYYRLNSLQQTEAKHRYMIKFNEYAAKRMAWDGVIMRNIIEKEVFEEGRRNMERKICARDKKE